MKLGGLMKTLNNSSGSGSSYGSDTRVPQLIDCTQKTLTVSQVAFFVKNGDCVLTSSNVFGENFGFVCTKFDFAYWSKKNPEIVCYTTEELALFKKLNLSQDQLRRAHHAKKVFKAIINLALIKQHVGH